MRNRIDRSISYSSIIQIICLLLMFIFAGSMQGFAEDDAVSIDNETFPDDVFREYVSTSFDKDQDELLSYDELKSITRIDLSGVGEKAGVEDLSGIEYFAALTYLDCAYTGVKSIDVSANAKLRELHAYQTPLEYIDVSNNASLKRLDLNNTEITDIDVTQNPDLFALNLEDTGITEVDLANNESLYEVYLTNDRIASLDITANHELGHVRISGTDITELDLSGNPDLMALYMMDTRIRHIDLSCVPKLYYLTAWKSDLEELDLHSNTGLNTVECWGTGIRELDVTSCSQLKGLDIHDTPISAIDLSGCPELQRLDVSSTGISRLDLSAVSSLRRIAWSDTAIGNLDLTRYTGLMDVECENAHVSVLDLSRQKNLHYLKCGGNALACVSLNPEAEMWMQDLGTQNAVLSFTRQLDGSLVCYLPALAGAAVRAEGGTAGRWTYDAAACRITIPGSGVGTICYSVDFGNGKAGTDVDPVMHVTAKVNVTAVDTVPAGKISSVRALKKGMRVKVRRRDCTGYQIQYSTHRNFKKARKSTWAGQAKTSKKIPKLKRGKRYYVRVRCYRVFNGRKYYGNYSKAVKIKIK